LNFEGEKILIATGRIPSLDDLDLDAAGIKYGRHGIEVNDFLQTNIPSIYAAGDAIPSLQLEHVAVYEGWLAAKNMYGAKKATDYRIIPRVMFSHPQVASVGETEEQAAKRTEIVTTSYPYAGIARAQIDRQKQGIIKLIADASTKKLLGAHIVGDEAGNLIHIASAIMKSGVELDKIADSVSAYPTLSQGFFYAIDQINEKLS